MSDEEKNAGDRGSAAAGFVSVPAEQPFLDEHTTEPNSPSAPGPVQQAAVGKWQMPKPKFQQTSGYLPQGYLKDIDPAAAAAAAPAGSEDTTQEQAPYAAAAAVGDGSAPPAIEPQPDLADQLVPDEPASMIAGSPMPAKGGSGGVMIVLGLIGILLFVAVFLAAVYFLFLANPSGGSIF